jgi:hypothetical protein
MDKIEKIINDMEPPKGCDWNFACGYSLAIRHFKEKLKKIKVKRKKKARKKFMIGDFSGAGESLKKMTPAQFAKLSVRLGIHNPDGTLTKKYR